MPSVRLALAILVSGTITLALLAYLEYGRLVDYCEGSPEVAAGGDSLSCLEPQHWFAESFIFGVLGLLELALLVVVGAAVVHVRSQGRLAPERASQAGNKRYSAKRS